jgi:hypothetical protein
MRLLLGCMRNSGIPNVDDARAVVPLSALCGSIPYFPSFGGKIEAIAARQLQRSVGLSSALSSANDLRREEADRDALRGIEPEASSIDQRGRT